MLFYMHISILVIQSCYTQRCNKLKTYLRDCSLVCATRKPTRVSEKPFEGPLYRFIIYIISAVTAARERRFHPEQPEIYYLCAVNVGNRFDCCTVVPLLFITLYNDRLWERKVHLSMCFDGIRLFTNLFISYIYFARILLFIILIAK